MGKKNAITNPQLLWWLVLFIGIFHLFPFPGRCAESIVIIANPSVPVDEISAGDIKRIYTGKMRLWENGDKIIITYSKEKQSLFEFFKIYINKTPRQFINYWRNMIFTGKSSSIPKGVSNEEELIRFISETKGAIGYVSSKNKINGVKILTVK